jgi:DNA polymerase-3 subunit gamma/tau
MAEAVLNGDLGAGLRILEETSAFGVDLKRLANDLLYYFRSLLICRVSDTPQKLLDLPDLEFEELRRIGTGHTVETLQLYFNMLLKGVETMQYSSHPRLAFEMTLIRAAEAGNVVPVTELLEKLGTLQSGTLAAPSAAAFAPVGKAPAPAAAERKKAEPLPKRVAPARPEKNDSQEKEAAVETPSAPVKNREESTTPKTAPQPAAAKAAPENLPPPSGREVRRNWDGFIDYVMDRKKWMAHTLRLSSSVREEDSDLILKFDDPSDCKVLQSKENMKFLTEFSQDFFQKEFKVRIKIRGGDLQGSVEETGTGPQEERRALAKDPLVQMATEILGGRVTNIRTGPRSR